MAGRDLYLRRVLDGALDAVIGIDADGVVLGWNAEAVRLLGWSGEEAEGRRLDELALAPGQWPALRAAAGARSELELTARDGQTVPVEAALTATDLGCGLVLIAFLRDLRPARRGERLRAAEQEVVRLIASAHVGSDPTEEVLDRVCATVGWPLGEWWRRDGDVLVRAAGWGDQAAAFATAGTRLALARGEGLAGAAWERGALMTMAELSDGARPRREVAAQAGITAGCAAPALVDGEVRGALTVWAVGPAWPLPSDAAGLLQSVATALGQFERRRSLERAQADELMALAGVARVVRRLSSSNDPAAARDAICDAAMEACDAAVAYLAEPDPDGGGLVVTAVAGAELHEGPPGVLGFDEPSAAMAAFLRRSPAFLPDISTASAAAAAAAAALGTVSGYVQPIVRGDDVLGVLGVGWKHRVHVFPERLAGLLELLADEAAIALGRAALVSDLEAAARTDPLTGLPNLRAWEESLSREIAAAARDGRPVCVAVADIDGFKGYNDAHGHLAGDRLLRSAVACWQTSLRTADVLARLGGDEFGALLPSCRLDGAVALAERLRLATPGDRTCSVGVAQWDGTEAPHELVARADAALYEAKNLGRDRVVAA